MKILKTIEFQLQIFSKVSDKKLTRYCYNFLLQTKHICNYIERICLKKLQCKTEKANGIVITFFYGYSDEQMSDCDIPYLVNNNIAINMLFDKKRYDKLKTDDELREFIYEYMVDAFKKIEIEFDIPSVEMLNSYDELKEKNFVNEWLWKRKTDRTRKLLAEIHCAITIDRCILILKVFQNKTEIYNNIILETTPDEYSYVHKVKKISIEEQFIKVLGTGDKITFSLPLDDYLC